MPLENGLWKISLADLAAKAKKRPAGYVEDVLSRAERVSDAHYWLTPAARDELMRKYLPQPTPDQLKIAGKRQEICSRCDASDGITPQGVKCRECGCGLVSFIHGKCKLGKWPEKAT